MLESRRYILDLAEATDTRAGTFGTALRSIIVAIKQIVQPERVYTISLAEMVPHLHVQIIPRTSTMSRAYKRTGILTYPLEPGPEPLQVEGICHRLRRELQQSAAPI